MCLIFSLTLTFCLLTFVWQVLLFEDDIRFEPFFKEHVDLLMRHVEEINLDWDLIYLGRKKLKQSDEPMVSDPH